MKDVIAIKNTRASDLQPGKLYVCKNSNSRALYMKDDRFKQSHYIKSIDNNPYSTRRRIDYKTIEICERNEYLFVEVLPSTLFGTMKKGTPILVRARNNMAWVEKEFADFDYDKNEVFRVHVLDPDKSTPTAGYKYALAVRTITF